MLQCVEFFLHILDLFDNSDKENGASNSANVPSVCDRVCVINPGRE